MSTLETINVIVTIVIFLAVALAGGQVIVFNLTAKSTKNLDLHKGITYIGMGAAGYALVGAKAHFSAEGWVGLVVGVLAIVGVTWMIQKFRRRNDHVIVKKQLSKLTDLNRFVEEHWRYDQQAPQNAKQVTKPSGILSRANRSFAVDWQTTTRIAIHQRP